MEKADILEMTVAYLRTVRRRRRATTTSAAAADSTDHRLPIVAVDLEAESPAACADVQRLTDGNRQRYAAGYVECATLVERYLTDIGSSLGSDVASVTSTIGDRLTKHLMISSPTCAECLEINGRTPAAAGLQLRTTKCHHRCAKPEPKALSPTVGFQSELPTVASETKPLACDSCYTPARAPAPGGGAPIAAAFPCRRDCSTGSPSSAAARCAIASRSVTPMEVNRCGDGVVSTTDNAATAPTEDSSDGFVAGRGHVSAAVRREGNSCVGSPVLPSRGADGNVSRASPPEDDFNTRAVWRPWAGNDQ